MKNYKIISSLIFLFIFQGCGDSGSSSSSNKTYPTTLGDATSVTTNEEGATMQPNQNSISKASFDVATVLDAHISEHNKQEAVSFDQSFQYCDISGKKDSSYKGSMKQVTETTQYNICKKENSLQNGTVTIDYKETNEDGKFPHSLILKINQNDYIFNNLTLKKGFQVEANNITYKQQKVSSLEVTITGILEKEHRTVSLHNIEQKISF